MKLAPERTMTMPQENIKPGIAPLGADTTESDARGTWRLIGLAIGAAGIAFWIYTFYAISKVPVGDGSSFQWLAEVPLTMIFLFVTVQALVLSFFRKSAQPGALLGVAGLLAFMLMWAQLLKELHG